MFVWALVQWPAPKGVGPLEERQRTARPEEHLQGPSGDIIDFGVRRPEIFSCRFEGLGKRERRWVFRIPESSWGEVGSLPSPEERQQLNEEL